MTKQDKIKKVMDEFKRGTLKTPDGKVVKNRKQALTIAMSESENYTEKGGLIHQLSISSVDEALDILKAAGTEDLFEKAKHQDGDMHPNGKWVWVASANGGKGDWRTAGGRAHSKSQAGATASSSSTGTSGTTTSGSSTTKPKTATHTQAIDFENSPIGTTVNVGGKTYKKIERNKWELQGNKYPSQFADLNFPTNSLLSEKHKKASASSQTTAAKKPTASSATNTVQTTTEQQTSKQLSDAQLKKYNRYVSTGDKLHANEILYHTYTVRNSMGMIPPISNTSTRISNGYQFNQNRSVVTIRGYESDIPAFLKKLDENGIKYKVGKPHTTGMGLNKSKTVEITIMPAEIGETPNTAKKQRKLRPVGTGTNGPERRTKESQERIDKKKNSKIKKDDVNSLTSVLKGQPEIKFKKSVSNDWNADITGVYEHNGKLLATVYWQGDSTDGYTSIVLDSNSLENGVMIPRDSKHNVIRFSNDKIKEVISTAVDMYNDRQKKTKSNKKNPKFNDENISTALKDPEVINELSQANDGVRIIGIENKGVINTFDSDTGEKIQVVQLLVSYKERKPFASTEKWSITVSSDGEKYYSSGEGGYHKASFKEKELSSFKKHFQ